MPLYSSNETPKIHQEIYELAKVGGWYYDLVENRSYWTETVYKIHELPFEFVPHPENAIHFFHPRFHKQLREAFLALRDEATPYDLEVQIIPAKSQQALWVRAKGKPHFEDGKLVRLYGTIQDIDEQKRLQLQLEEQRKAVEAANQALEEQKAFLDSIIENLPNGLQVYDEKGVSMRMNEAQRAFLGLPSTETGIGEYNILKDHVLGKGVRDSFLKAYQGEKVQYETWVELDEYQPNWRTRSAKIFFEQTLVPIKNSQKEVSAVIALIKDITLERISQEQLASFHTALKKLNHIATTPGLSFTSQIEQGLKLLTTYYQLELGIVSQIEGEIYTVLHIEPEHDFGISEGDYFPLRDTLCRHTFQNNHAVFAEDVAEHIYYKQHPCYGDTPFRAYIAAPLNVNGKRFGTVNFSASSARRRAFNSYEKEFINIFSRWVGFLIEREEYAQQLVASNISKDQILEVVAHDLRGPISSVKGLVNLIEQPQQDTKELHVYTDLILKACGQAESLILELLESARVEHERLQHDMEVQNLKEFVATFSQNHQNKALLQEIELSCELPEENAWVKLDSSKFHRIMENLLTNAIKFTPPKGQIHLSVRVEGGKAVVEVRDSGIGIPEKMRKTLFQRFSTARRKGLRGEKSVGIGLSIVKHLVELHQGEIEVESEEGKGSTFRIRLPLAAQTVLSSANHFA